MHITKNVFENLFATLLNMREKTKDGPKARNDLIHLGIREELHGGIESSDEEMNRHKGKKVIKNDYHCPPSCFTLIENELQQLIKCLLGVKTPFGYCGLINRYLDQQKQRFSGTKSHDCHVMMMQIFLVVIRGIMDKHVHET